MAKLNGKTISDQTWKRAEVTEVRYLSYSLIVLMFHDAVDIVRRYIAYKFAFIFKKYFFQKLFLSILFIKYAYYVCCTLEKRRIYFMSGRKAEQQLRLIRHCTTMNHTARTTYLFF